MSLNVEKVKNGDPVTVRRDGEFLQATYLHSAAPAWAHGAAFNARRKGQVSPGQPRDMFVEGITSDRDVRDAQREQARRASTSDSEEESEEESDDATTISHIRAHKSGSAWRYEVRDSLSGNWSYKEPKYMVTSVQVQGANGRTEEPGRSRAGEHRLRRRRHCGRNGRRRGRWVGAFVGNG